MLMIDCFRNRMPRLCFT